MTDNADRPALSPCSMANSDRWLCVLAFACFYFRRRNSRNMRCMVFVTISMFCHRLKENICCFPTLQTLLLPPPSPLSLSLSHTHTLPSPRPNVGEGLSDIKGLRSSWNWKDHFSVISMLLPPPPPPPSTPLTPSHFCKSGGEEG